MNKSKSYHDKQDNYSQVLIKSTSVMTKQSPITLLNQVSSTRKHDQCPTLHIMAFRFTFHIKIITQGIFINELINI